MIQILASVLNSSEQVEIIRELRGIGKKYVQVGHLERCTQSEGRISSVAVSAVLKERAADRLRDFS